MERQLLLLDDQPDWRLDEHTRQVGRAGIREARAALQRAARQAAGCDSADEAGGNRHAA